MLVEAVLGSRSDVVQLVIFLVALTVLMLRALVLQKTC